MLTNPNDTIAQLEALKLTRDEARVYLELLQEPSTHLQISNVTGINRTKIYRIVTELERQSLVARRTDDRGTFLVASDPSVLEVRLIQQEEDVRAQRRTLQQLAPILSQLQNNDSRAFVVRAYEGQGGIKQMLWHELKAKQELLFMGEGTIEEMIKNSQWTRRFREHQLAAPYITRAIVNFDYTTTILSKLITTKNNYAYRIIPPDLVTFNCQTTVYNDTVSIIHWKYDQQVGVEIISPKYAEMMRQIFESYWALGRA